ncbi:MAG: DEAD/DEAH box helicase [Bacillota bacterium]|jgi:ATP-dependent RNA helicase CshB|nr:DEAD/DEAH box helicase [Bacillota bacterium]NLL26876.1 DEAD/DEAH box helicase [Erysipelotrichia bacterium]
MNFKFREDIQQLIEYKRFKDFSPIQKKAIPLILDKKDVIGVSATGTGKSHAFILPILQMVDSSLNEIQAIIAAPTRELAIQLYTMISEINMFNEDINIKLIASGKDKERMIEGLKTQPHIVVGTIGRLKDLFVDEAVLRLDTAKTIVIDEADMTLELGFLEQVDEICGRLPKKLQMLVFSATIPSQLQPFLRKYMNRPTLIEATEQHELSPDIEHVLVNCRYASYTDKLLKILPGIQPYVCMIFARTKQEVISVAELLKKKGYDIVEIHGDLSNRERKQALKAISADKTSYIVCSDIMARGLDIESVSHVISLGLPSSLNYYTHRSGRTGRAGRSGTSYVLFNQSDYNGIKVLRNQGFEFLYKDYRRGQWVDVKPFDFRPTRKKLTEEDHEIQKILKKPVKKVKPGYKKKRQAEIDKIRRRQRRLKIKASIKQQQKERAKQAQREKRELNK